MNIVIDGPEKAGKTTTIALLAKELKKKYSIVDVLKWTGRAKPDDREYSDELRMYAAAPEAIAIWDRAWPSEFVYGKLLSQDRRLADDPWLGAWLHDRAVAANGLRVMMLGYSAGKLASLRDSSDLAVNPETEIQLYREYAKRFGWLTLQGYQYDRPSLQENVARLLRRVEVVRTTGQPLPPLWSGPQDAEVVFIGNSNKEKFVPGGWLPFTSKNTIMFGRMFGDEAVEYAWTHVRNCNPAYLRNRRVLVACGNQAQVWIQNYVANKENTDQKIFYLPHPSYLFKFKDEQAKKNINTVLEQIRKVLS